MTSDGGREIGEKRRRDRLAAALRENLKRRKAQQRDRARETSVAGDPSQGDRPTKEFSLPTSGAPTSGDSDS